MKALIGLIWFVLLMQADLTFAQPQKIAAARVSLQLHDAPLRQALDEIAKQTNMPIIYSDALIDGIQVSCNCNDWTIQAAFNYLLKNTKLDCMVTPNGQIVLLNKRQATQHKGVLRGFVKDQANGETISFVSVVLEGTGFGAASDENGYFVISGIPAGQYVAQARLIGYETAQREITIAGGKTVTLNFQLESMALDLDAVVVTADRERFERQVEPSALQLSPREIASTPAFVEADLFRALQTLPGVTARTDFSGALYIRGGNPSENIILLDDVRIYNPYHMGGVFSSFNTDAIKSVDISVGGFPPRYGNAVSGVIAITNKDGNSKEFAAKGSVSLVSSKLTLEHPIP
ncbi:MAG: carboxypeptidase-like regulatory domain-containing protein, partial [bacterium]